MKKILFITALTPNDRGAGVAYTNRLLIELSKTCLIDLVYFRYADEKPFIVPNDYVKVVREEVIGTQDKLKSLFLMPGVFPLFTARYKKEVQAFLQIQVNNIQYDYVYFDFSQSFCYAKYINHPNKILMSHDVIAQKYSRMKRYLRPWAVCSERKMLKYGKVVFTFSEKDCQLIRDLYHIDSYATTFFLNDSVLAAKPTIDSDYFVFFGSWGREENSEALNWFIDNVYGLIKNDCKFKVVGGGQLPDSIKQKIEKLGNMDYLGFMDNPYEIIANAKAEIAPLHMGAGVKVKCVEALGCGTPVIGTEVAFEGVGDKYRYAMYLANKPEEFADIINKFDFSLERKQKLKEYFVESYNNKQILNYINVGM